MTPKTKEQELKVLEDLEHNKYISHREKAIYKMWIEKARQEGIQSERERIRNVIRNRLSHLNRIYKDDIENAEFQKAKYELCLIHKAINEPEHSEAETK